MQPGDPLIMIAIRGPSEIGRPRWLSGHFSGCARFASTLRGAVKFCGGP
jgi:hypothetical protein